jgi:alternate signal-mediated exported protein
MKRTTKIAASVGAAALLLIGGAGSLAYWSQQATATSSASLNTGNLVASAADCTQWKWVSGTTLSPGTVVTTKIIPGQVVESDCTVTVTGEGQDLAVTATITQAGWTNQGNPAASTTDFVSAGGDVVQLGTVTTVDGVAYTASTPIPIGTVAKTVKVTVTATFPYNTSGASPNASPGDTGLSGNSSMNLSDTLKSVQINFIQANPGTNP